jgi:glycosyltransferase involved in cell wall biosynthesis
MNILKKRTGICFLFLLNCLPTIFSCDINLIGFLDDSQSVSRHTSSFIDCLNDLDRRDIKLFATKACSGQDLNIPHQNIVRKSIDLNNRIALQNLIKQGLKLSGVTVYTGSNLRFNAWDQYLLVPNESTLRFAYCVTERTVVSKEIVALYNNNFDALIVPDEWLIDVYKSSGVTIPIFVLPLVLDLHSLLSKPKKTPIPKPFVFGFSGIFWPRKNHDLLISAFHAEFKHDSDVQLLLHGRFPDGIVLVKKLLTQLKNKKITIIQKEFGREEYENFISSLDCYVLLSKGEGFSITPREAIAAGIPCILSNNTAHKIICKNSCVYPVDSNIKEASFCQHTQEILGHEFNCDINDVRKALREVYENYEKYYERAQQGRTWVKSYFVENLRPFYISLVKPKKVILGDRNMLGENFLMTDSQEFFEKYKMLCDSENTVFEGVAV